MIKEFLLSLLSPHPTPPGGVLLLLLMIIIPLLIIIIPLLIILIILILMISHSGKSDCHVDDHYVFADYPDHNN